MSFKVCVSLLIFCFVDLSIGVSGKTQRDGMGKKAGGGGDRDGEHM